VKRKTKPKLPRPTASEIEILRVLWETGPATVRQVHEILDSRRTTGYTTVLKLMQIMATKGLLVRDEALRAHIYKPALERSETQGRIVDELLEKVFAGSASELVMQAISRGDTSKKEIEEIRRMLDEVEGEKGWTS